jgi:5'-nucleotidase
MQALEESLQGLANLLVVAPDRERSAVSHGLTIHSPLSLERVAEHRYTLNGTPADCVIYALTRILQHPPDLVVSGINRGANLGDDIMYSGTVAAAREASRHGIPSMAISQAIANGPVRFERGARFAQTLARLMIEQKSNGGMCLNVNIPVSRVRGVQITRQGCAVHFPHFNSLDGREGLAAVKQEHLRKSEIPLDYQAVMDQFISITPLHRDSTDYTSIGSLLRVAPLLVES